MTLENMHARLRARNAFVLRVSAIVVAVGLLAPLHAAQSHSFLWKAAGKGSVVYLAGSIHMLSPDFYPLNPVFDNAFKDTDLLVEEIDFGEMIRPESQMQAMMRGLLPSGQTLDKVLSPATLALVTKAAKDLGAPMEALQRFKPWMLALTLEGLELASAGFDPQLGLDKHFYDLAQGSGKAVQGLETVDFQLSRLDGMTAEQQDRMLAQTLKEIDTGKASVAKLTTAWKTGDADGVERLVLGTLKAEPVLYERLLVERNRNWLPKIEALFARKGNALVLVGAAHLVGPDGLLAMLKAKGYSIEQQ
jgi:uncharacterized protein YbaP (TraB family)